MERSKNVFPGGDKLQTLLKTLQFSWHSATDYNYSDDITKHTYS